MPTILPSHLFRIITSLRAVYIVFGQLTPLFSLVVSSEYSDIGDGNAFCVGYVCPKCLDDYYMTTLDTDPNQRTCKGRTFLICVPSPMTVITENITTTRTLQLSIYFKHE